MSSRLGALACAGLLTVVGAQALASVAVSLDLDQLTARADHVWVARCVDARSRYDERGRIVTDLTLEVDENLKGPHRPGEPQVVTVLGGSVGEVGMQVAGAASIPVGGEAVVFARGPSAGRLRPVGMAQGVLPIVNERNGRMVHPGGRGMHLVRGGQTSRTAPAPGALSEPLPLHEVTARIRSAVAAQTGNGP